ncbi:MAG TPA: hypothetical protein VKQ32_25485 [Polyangia bacterium]|nr:hypothetical protein [Polyangia bacterium]
MKHLASILATATLMAACGSSTTNPPPQPATITFQLHNDGQSTVYVFESCQIDFTITSLADPVHQIALEGACACACGEVCPVCGPCFEGARDVASGTMATESWNAVNVTVESSPTGSCERRIALPDGPYRIDVPVYASQVDAMAHTSARTASQSFTLPVSGNTVDVALGVSP